MNTRLLAVWVVAGWLAIWIAVFVVLAQIR
jgi:hypothetical protein